MILNAAVLDAGTDGNRIVSVSAYQSTAQTFHTIAAKTFVDCSGDSILAALTPADFRQGREARAEFDEDIQPENADDKNDGQHAADSDARPPTKSNLTRRPIGLINSPNRKICLNAFTASRRTISGGSKSAV